jgi:shikimate kinase
MMSLFLIGPRGAGKSAVGARVAARLGRPFVDADRLVEGRAGQGVAQLFETRGEQAFRALEREVMLELLARRAPSRVVATGGGCVLDADVRAGLQRAPGVLWLRASLATLQARIAGGQRPSLTGGDPRRELAAIVRQRRPLYAACARQALDTTTLTIEEAADVIQQLWTELSRHHLR